MNIGDQDRDAYKPASNDRRMFQELPQLIMSVKAKWREHQLDPNHDRIDDMRREVEMLLYWLSRQAVKSRMGAFGGKQITDLQHDVYNAVRDRNTVTNLVEGATGDFVAYLARIAANEKTNGYRKHKVEKSHVIPIEDLLPVSDSDERRKEELLMRPEDAALSAERCFEGCQCLAQFSEFIEKQQLHVDLERVAWALWMAGTLSDKHSGDISENSNNTDIALAREIGMPKKRFDRYKRKAALLVESFRQQTKW